VSIFFQDDNLKHFETQKDALFLVACDFILLTADGMTVFVHSVFPSKQIPPR
jgi:hypothetical protein